MKDISESNLSDSSPENKGDAPRGVRPDDSSSSPINGLESEKADLIDEELKIIQLASQALRREFSSPEEAIRALGEKITFTTGLERVKVNFEARQDAVVALMASWKEAEALEDAALKRESQEGLLVAWQEHQAVADAKLDDQLPHLILDEAQKLWLEVVLLAEVAWVKKALKLFAGLKPSPEELARVNARLRKFYFYTKRKASSDAPRDAGSDGASSPLVNKLGALVACNAYDRYLGYIFYAILNAHSAMRRQRVILLAGSSILKADDARLKFLIEIVVRCRSPPLVSRSLGFIFFVDELRDF